MAKRKAFLLRVDPAVLDALQKWADDDLRSLNGQIEYVLRQSLNRAGRKVRPAVSAQKEAEENESEETQESETKDGAHPGRDSRSHPGK